MARAITHAMAHAMASRWQIREEKKKNTPLRGVVATSGWRPTLHPKGIDELALNERPMKDLTDRLALAGRATLAALACDQPDDLHAAAEIEQEHLWDDLNHEMRWARDGQWSIACEALVHRIVSLARFVGPTRWDSVQVGILQSGVYQAILDAANLRYPPINWEAVEETATANG